MKISEYFTQAEVSCKCGCGFYRVAAETLAIADEARAFVGHAIVPSSVCRCVDYNATIEGASEVSQHLPRFNKALGCFESKAIDLPTPKAARLYAYLDTKYGDQVSLGLYKDFVHIDTRTNGGARWR